MKKPNKKQREQLRQSLHDRFAAFMAEIGAHPTGDGAWGNDWYRLDTPVGDWSIQPYLLDKHDSTPWIPTQFADCESADKVTGCGRTGKWNFHCFHWEHAMDGTFMDGFERSVRNVLQGVVNAQRLCDRPLAAEGLVSYRYPTGRNVYMMIGARDDADALNEANRGLARKTATLEFLEKWDGEKYTKVVLSPPS